MEPLGRSALAERPAALLVLVAPAMLARITRSTVDLTTQRLVRRGFLNKIKVGRRLRYIADAPEALLFRQKQLVEDLEQVVPLLSKIGNQQQDTEVIYFEGGEGYVRAHEDVLLNMTFAEGEKKDLLSFSSKWDSCSDVFGITLGLKSSFLFQLP